MKRNGGKKLLLLLSVFFIISLGFTQAEKLENDDAINELQRKKLKFDTFYKTFSANLLAGEERYNQEVIEYGSECLFVTRDDLWGEEYSDEAWEKIPKRNIDMESLFEQAKMTNLVTEEELRDALHSFMAMNQADSCEIYADVINRMISKNFDLKMKEFQKVNGGISE